MFNRIYTSIKKIINTIFNTIQEAFLRVSVRREATNYVKEKMPWHSA